MAGDRAFRLGGTSVAHRRSLQISEDGPYHPCTHATLRRAAKALVDVVWCPQTFGIFRDLASDQGVAKNVTRANDHRIFQALPRSSYLPCRLRDATLPAPLSPHLQAVLPEHQLRSLFRLRRTTTSTRATSMPSGIFPMLAIATPWPGMSRIWFSSSSRKW